MSVTLAPLEDAIRALALEGKWEHYLQVQARFHSYSARNALLIAQQCPHATRVAGYKTWQSLNRQVLKGSKAIRIVAPTRRDDELVSFRMVSVFDVSQTTGEALPITPQLLRGEDPVGLFDALADVAIDQGFQVSLTTLPEGINGLCSHLDQTIMVAQSLPSQHRAKTLAHELGHALLHRDKVTRAIAEFEAESIAYIVCRAFGIESSEYSFNYILQWAGGPQPALEAIIASGERIRTTAESLITAAEVMLSRRTSDVA